MKTQLSKPARVKASYTDQQTGSASVMACQRPQCGQGGSGTGYSTSATLSLGTAGGTTAALHRQTKRIASGHVVSLGCVYIGSFT